MKKFFSNIWFRCISTLLVIICISGCSLSILSDLLYVSSQERTDRAIKKIYGEIQLYNTVLDGDVDGTINYDFGFIDKIYEVQVNENESYLLFKSTGKEGYKGGSISLWISVAEDVNGTLSIKKVILDGYEKQTLMSKLTSSFYGNYNLTDVTEAYEKGELFSTNESAVNFNPITGATKSANAANNAVNCVIKYLGENYEN